MKISKTKATNTLEEAIDPARFSPSFNLLSLLALGQDDPLVLALMFRM
jgi:hypothetical protein